MLREEPETWYLPSKFKFFCPMAGYLMLIIRKTSGKRRDFQIFFTIVTFMRNLCFYQENPHCNYMPNCFTIQLPKVLKPQATQAHYVWVWASEVIWSDYTRIISVLSDAK